jgi:hypothetical protein
VRRICPAADASYTVRVTDSGESGEVPTPPQTARASVAAEVLECGDGGLSSGGLCIANPSFEGTAGATIQQIDAAPWVSCVLGLSFGNIWSASQAMGIAPSDGSTYLRLGTITGAEPGAMSSASEPLCAPMGAGTTYHLKMDVAYEAGDSTAPSSVQIWGGTASCAGSLEDGGVAAELLWSSAPVTSGRWTTLCETLSPTASKTYLTVAASVERTVIGNTSGVFVDNLVPVTSCP